MEKLTGKQIRELRLHLGLTQTEFAGIFEKTRGAIQHWESGVRSPTKKDRYTLVLMERAVEANAAKA